MMQEAACSLARDYPAGHSEPMHRHQTGQLIFAIRGVMTVMTHTRVWQIPPQLAVWIPPGTDHAMQAREQIALRTLYIRSEGWPAEPRSATMTPWLRELVLRTARTTDFSDPDGRDRRILALLRDEIVWEDIPSLPLPPETEPRLCMICQALLDDPAHPAPLDDWALQTGTSTRTLARLFKQHLGVTFQFWRQQVRVMAAIPRLSAGEPVTRIAIDLGYETPAAFSAMFKRMMQSTPRHFQARMSGST